MTPAKTPSKRDMLPQLSISCGQARLPVEELRHQPSRNFNLQSVLIMEYAGGNLGSEIVRVVKQ